MANSYAILTANETVKCSQADYDRLVEQLEKEASEELFRNEDFDDPSGVDFEYYKDDGDLYIYSDEGGASPENISKELLTIIGEIVGKAGLPYLECGIAYYCDKARPGSAGGSAVRFYPDGELVFGKFLFEKS